MANHERRAASLGKVLGRLIDLYRRGATGTLEYEVRGASRSLHLIEGELYFSPEHPLGVLLGSVGARSADSEGYAAAERAARQLAMSLAERSATETRFREGLSGLPVSRMGPLPTARVIRLVASHAISPESWIERFLPDPGASIRTVEPVPGAERMLRWEPEELWILERLRQPMPHRGLESDAPFPVDALRRALAGLLAVGVVRPEGTLETVRDLPSTEDLERVLGDRIRTGLAERPLDLAASDYQDQIIALLGSAGGLDHYELLGVRPGVEIDELGTAFEEVARLVHPANAARYGLAKKIQVALDYLFGLLVEAYQTLADPDSRIAYDARHQIEPVLPAPSPEERAAESRAMARRNFERARDEEAQGDLHTALQLLEQVVRTDARVEYWLALARLQRKNPAWSNRALASYRAALEIDPQSSEVRFELGELLEATGDLERARGLYQAAAAGNPPHAGAKEALARLDREAGGGSGSRRLGRLFGRG